MVNTALEGLTQEFEAMYSHTGRPSIAPEQLLRALLLQVLYSIRSERLLVEQLDYNLLFRWFVGLSMDERVWDHSTFTKNRERLIGSDIARAFFGQVLGQAREGRLLSDEHFSVDGTLLEAWASMKSFRPKDGDGRAGGGGRNAEADFHGEKRSNATHQSSTDPQARLYRKGQASVSRKASHLTPCGVFSRHTPLIGDAPSETFQAREYGATAVSKRERLIALRRESCLQGPLLLFKTCLALRTCQAPKSLGN